MTKFRGRRASADADERIEADSPRETISTEFYQRALDAEAEIWARETNTAEWIAEMSPPSAAMRAALLKFAKQCFVEGVDRGVRNAVLRKSLQESIAEADYGAGHA